MHHFDAGGGSLLSGLCPQLRCLQAPTVQLWVEHPVAEEELTLVFRGQREAGLKQLRKMCGP